jgi:hypothetical protein
LQKAKEQQLKHTLEKEHRSEKTLKDYIREGCISITKTAYEYTRILDVIISQAAENVALA